MKTIQRSGRSPPAQKKARGQATAPRKDRFERRPKNHFEVLLHRWRLGEDVKWSDLFAAWVMVPLAPRSPEVVRKVIRKVEWT